MGADRLRKYLARFELGFDDIRRFAFAERSVLGRFCRCGSCIRMPFIFVPIAEDQQHAGARPASTTSNAKAAEQAPRYKSTSC
jgi:hypothetical protein